MCPASSSALWELLYCWPWQQRVDSEKPLGAAGAACSCFPFVPLSAVPAVASAYAQAAARIGFGAWGSGWQEWNGASAWVGSEMEAEFEGCCYCCLSATWFGLCFGFLSSKCWFMACVRLPRADWVSCVLSVGGVLQKQQLELFQVILDQESGWTAELMSK